MANTGKKKSADLRKTVEGRLRSAVRPGEHVVVGLSGGVDSVTLLSIVVSVRKALGISVTAVHVNHGLSPNAEKWAYKKSLKSLAYGYYPRFVGKELHRRTTARDADAEKRRSRCRP